MKDQSELYCILKWFYWIVRKQKWEMQSPQKYLNTVNPSFQNEKWTHSSNNGVTVKQKDQYLWPEVLSWDRNRQKRNRLVWSGNTQLPISQIMLPFTSNRKEIKFLDQFKRLTNAFAITVRAGHVNLTFKILEFYNAAV